ALSVGIGFGLQSIVNNFVSGLILLVERPVKVGDWIVVKGQEGYVRRISVRATEIETFDRASLIIPNSELITGTVTNWTHRNAMGRLIIKVGVSYEADPERVRDILMAVAENSAYVLKEPAPRVALDDLGPNALDFSLRVFIPDVTRALDVQTELRLAILKRFQMAGIEIPNAQYDVHLRDLDRLRQALALAFEARRKEKEAECRS
ncbi:MAG TPA: mechanosensitive ion channel domain-containing protein, partial [Hyphomicrobiaceae bacterium]|nr:mechanosensitive ion channel domain-containing protein [Hyphomicrobiaceae bacterium]